MAQKLTAKEEAFSQALVSGKNQSDAYRAAGYSCSNAKTVSEAASRLAKSSKVIARMAELRAPAVKRAEITLESHLASLKALRDAATQTGDFSPAVSAEVARGKASGLYVEKVKHSGEIKNHPSIDYSKYSVDELKQLRGLLAKQ